MGERLKDKAIRGMLWSGVGKFGTMLLTFVSNIVLARLLMPSDYGVIGMLNVFIAVSSILVSAGFGSALVQKKIPTHTDFTSVFWWNLVAGVLLYATLFFSAHAIAGFYKMPELCAVLRVQSISLIIQAFSTVQSCQLQKQLRFKELSMRNVMAALVGTVIAIVMAMCGCGVWSLVVNHLVGTAMGVLLLWRMSDWRPTWEFSWQSLKELISFGGLMALSSLVETLYSNILSLLLGRWYSPAQLGYYAQARKLESVPTEALGSIVGSVSFPLFSQLQDDIPRLRSILRRNIMAVMFLNVPLMIMLAVVAEPLVLILYGEKWRISISYFQILCFGGAMYTLNSLNMSVMKSLGKSNVYFWVQFCKRLFSLMLIFVAFWLGRKGMIDGVRGLIWVVMANYYIFFVVNAFVNRSLVGYGLWQQMKDVVVYFALSAISAIGTILVGKLTEILLLKLVVQCVTFVLIYLLLSRLLNIEAMKEYEIIIKNKIHER